ncbi:MAG: DUF7948 domain-containing protein [Planctomycetota bacterium]|jgi:hypothetical protein
MCRFLIALIVSWFFLTWLAHGAGGPVPQRDLDAAFARLPLYFIENRGQVDEQAAYYVQGSDRILYFEAGGVTFSLLHEEDGKLERDDVLLSFLGADLDAMPRGEDRQQAVFSFFRGGEDNWHRAVPSFGRLVYADLWPGIDLVYSGTIDRLKYEFVVKPGADPSRIRLTYHGISGLSVKENGTLEIVTPAGSLEDGAPYAYQIHGSEMKEVSMRYALQEGAGDTFAFGFDVGEYDPEIPLVLDPAFLVYCGYLGSIDSDTAFGIDVDSEGYAYVAGYYFQQAMVIKVDVSGSSLVYSAYLLGDDLNYCTDVAVDEEFCAYVTGFAQSDETAFPVKVGPDLTFNGEFDAFVAKVTADGTDLVYCGYIGGGKTDYCHAVDVDTDGSIVVAGYTKSKPTGFPAKVGPDLTYNDKGGSFGDTFVARVTPDGADLVYCGFIGGWAMEMAEGIVLDGAGNAYVTGWTESDESSFPVMIGPRLIHGGAEDAFVARVKADGTQLEYCGFIGGEYIEYGEAIDLGDDNSAYVVGFSGSDENTFPIKTGPDLTYNGGDHDAFIAKVKADGTDLVYCGYIGGALKDVCEGVAVDKEGHAYVTGRTLSDETTFPVKLGPDLTFNIYYDAFAARVNADGTDLDFCGYIGGEGADWGQAITLDGQGNAYVTGDVLASGSGSAFPVKIGPELTYNGGFRDAFVAKLVYGESLLADQYTLSETGGSVSFSLDAGVENAGRNYLMLGSVTGITPGHPLPGGITTLPLVWDPYTDVVLLLMNSPLFIDFLGSLDSGGQAAAQLFSPALPPGYVGMRMYYAFCLNNFFDFASNPVEIEIVQ